MRKRIWLGTAIAAGLLFPWSVGEATAQSPTMVTLACEGQASFGSDPGTKVLVNIILNLTDGTVKQEMMPFATTKIKEANDLSISFSGSQDSKDPEKYRIDGSIDRVTGRTAVFTRNEKLRGSYILQCKPTKRLF
jgi:hypothetical protein